ncbi:MAG TPA: alpha-amylase/4-alpha-glucanotransferase domain-containing protein [Candidatus Limnocylindrales bacterium]|nr:alpha-amylase/4-alpha-glucanotransferase domain-containing protein [Candidatus Limnocylindrales bacterium]
MGSRISLALAIHNHQPVGNFGWVFAEVYDQAYRPMLEALERHPGVRLSLHYTGPLLEWLRAERPDFVEGLRALVERNQVELLGGGLYEPVLASLPERDRVAQLRRMADELEAMTGRRPRGAWLAERVWEPDLPTSLVKAGYGWTILDDAHFRAAAIPEENLWGAYTTEDQGHVLTVFGTEQGLRYRIPFGEVDDVIAYLRDHATEDGGRVGMMGDDGEKFGAWPTTWEHCWGRGRWVDRFFDALEKNASWLTTVTPSDWLEHEPPIGRVYVPTSSYAEMGEWALPADEALVFADLLHAAVAGKRPEARWLRGGFWRNFQVKYREINDLHKQMLRASDKVALMPDGLERLAALDHLHRGQSNDCYWHGLFGGIYISHMRLATLEHLIAAEDSADRAAGVTSAAELRDVDLDGRDEALLLHPGQVVTVDLDEGAGIGSWDIRAPRHAMTAVMRRRPEAYHATLRRHEAAAAAAAAIAASQPSDGAGPASIHDVVRTKEADLSAHLDYDDHERRSGLVRFLAPGTTPDDVATARARELGDFVEKPFEVVTLERDRLVVERDGRVEMPDGPRAVRVEKILTLGGDRATPSLGLEVAVENRSAGPIEAVLGIEWSITMLGGGGNPAAWYEVGGRRSAHDGGGIAAAAARVDQGNDYIGLSVATTASPPADAWWAPIETVSNSEAGFERIYQGTGLLLSWPLRLKAGARTVVRVDHVVAATRDRAAEESAAATTGA